MGSNVKTEKLLTCVDDAVYTIQSLPMNLLFRGQVNDTWLPQPTLLRREMSYKWEIYEFVLFDYLIQNKKNIPYVKMCDPFEYFATLQHFGVPTRLLDVTNDIYTALFFACYDPTGENIDRDGILYLINKDLFFEEQLIKAPDFLSAENIDVMHKRLDFSDIRLVTPFTKNPRSRSQHGQFLCFPFVSIAGNEGHYVTLNDFSNFANEELKKDFSQKNPNKDWSNFKVPILMYVKIDKTRKKAILDELDYLYGINEQFLFASTSYATKVEPFFRYLQWYAMQHAEILYPLVEKIKTLDITREEKCKFVYDQYLKNKEKSTETFHCECII